MPCLSATEGAECVAPSIASALDGSYPIARPLFMYTAGAPEGAVAEYLNWIQSQEGQCILIELGYAPREAVNCS
jgi:phosphate transport system substrate-binding protein